MLVIVLAGASISAFATDANDGNKRDEGGGGSQPAADQPTTPAPPAEAPKPEERSQGLGEHLWEDSYHAASKASWDAAAGATCQANDTKCIESQESLKGISKTQSILGDVSVASDLVAGAGVAAYAYGEFGLKKKESDSPESEEKNLHKLAKVQKMAGTALIGSGAVDLATGVYGRFVVDGQLKDIQDQGAIDASAALQQNVDSSWNHIYWGAGKGAVGYLITQQAKKTEKQAKELGTVKPGSDDTSGASKGANIDPASQQPNNQFLFGGGNNAPTIAPTEYANYTNPNSGASIAEPGSGYTRPHEQEADRSDMFTGASAEQVQKASPNKGASTTIGFTSGEANARGNFSAPDINRKNDIASVYSEGSGRSPASNGGGKNGIQGSILDHKFLNSALQNTADARDTVANDGISAKEGESIFNIATRYLRGNGFERVR